MKQIIVSLILLLASGFAAHASDPNPQPAPSLYALSFDCGVSIIVPGIEEFSSAIDAFAYYDSKALEWCGYYSGYWFVIIPQ